VFSGHVSKGGGSWIEPGEEFIEATVGMAVDDLRDGRREIGAGIDIVEFAGLDQRNEHGPMFGATIGAPHSAFLRLSAIGRIARSTTLESISMRPSSTKRQSPSQRESTQRIASASVVF
jgi:hypothetical protein